MSMPPSKIEKNKPFLSRVTTRQWAALILVILAIVFVLQNHHDVPITLYIVDITAPMWLVLLVLFVAGWLTGVFTTKRKAKARQALGHGDSSAKK